MAAKPSREITVCDQDVLFGRCKEAKTLAQTHPGTLSIKELAQKHADVYEMADKTPSDFDEPGKVTKQSLNLMVLNEIKQRGGRVLIKDKPTDPWKQVPKHKVISNISSLFRRKKPKTKPAKKNQVTPAEASPGEGRATSGSKSKKSGRPGPKKADSSQRKKAPAALKHDGEASASNGGGAQNLPFAASPSLHSADAYNATNAHWVPPTDNQAPLVAAAAAGLVFPDFHMDMSGRTSLDSSGSVVRSLLGPDDSSRLNGIGREDDLWKQQSLSGPPKSSLAQVPEFDAFAAAMDTTKRDRGGTGHSVCSSEPVFQKPKPTDIVDDDSILASLRKRPPLEAGRSLTDVSQSELSKDALDDFDCMSTSLSRSEDETRDLLQKIGAGLSTSQRSDGLSNTRSLFDGGSVGQKPTSMNTSDHSFRSLLGSNASNPGMSCLSSSLARSEGSNARSFLSGSSFGMSAMTGSRSDVYSHGPSLATFSMSTAVAPLPQSGADNDRGSRSHYGSMTSSKQPSVVSDDDETFADVVDRMSSVSIEQSDISSLTFQTPRNPRQTERIRGGRMAVDRPRPALRMPDDTVIRTSVGADIDDDDSALTMGNDMDVCKLLDRMKSEPEDALLQIRCFGELAEIAWEHMTEDVSKEVVDSMQDLISIMNKHRDDSQVQSHCCLAFGWLASNNATLKRFIAFFGGVEAIVHALKEHEEDELAQANGCSALSSLACNDSPNQQKIASEGGIQVVVRAMDQNLECADVQKYGCSALSYIAKGNTANTLSVANGDGVMAIVRAMKMHGDNDEVQINGIWALGTLSSKITSVRDSIAKTGGIGAILSGMQHHPESEEVQTSGCMSLQHLAVEQYLDSFLDAKGIEIILAAMDFFKSNETIQMIGCVVVGKIVGSSVEAQEATTFAGGINTLLSVTQRTWTDLNVNNEARISLGRLAKNNNVAQKRIARAVVCAMTAARQDADVQANCCCTLETIAKQDSESRQWIVAAGGVEAVRAARLNHPNKDDIWTMTLASLTSHELAEEASTEAVEEMLNIVNTMDECEDLETEQENSCRNLVKLLSSNSHNPNVGGTFVSDDGMAALITAMDLFPANLRIQGNGCASLYMLCVDNIEGRSNFMDEGGAQVLVSTMNNWPTRESVQCYGCKVLELLVMESSRGRRDVYEAGAWRVLHDAKALFPKNSGLIKAADNTLSLLVREVGMGVISQGNHSGFRAGSNAVVPPV